MFSGGLVQFGNWLMSQGEFGVVGGFCLLILGFVTLLIWVAATSAIAVAIVTESSEGNDEVEHGQRQCSPNGGANCSTC